MREFGIEAVSESLRAELWARVDGLTKPKGSLGMLERLAVQVGLIQNTLEPELRHPHIYLFAGDHGVEREGVSLSPRGVTWQMVFNFVRGGAGINFLARQHGFRLRVVDVGVDYDFPPTLGIMHRKVGYGTCNFAEVPAMTESQLEEALGVGVECVEEAYSAGSNVVAFGEMGIANTSASSVWMHLLGGVPLARCVGAGCDHTGEVIGHKLEVLRRGVEGYRGDGGAWSVMLHFGGYEMVSAVGGMLAAASRRMVVLVDGFIMGACALAAIRIAPRALDYFVFGHLGDESGHAALLATMGAEPLLRLGMRLGEGTGAVCAYPVLESAVRMLREMARFEEVDVTKYF